MKIVIAGGVVPQNRVLHQIEKKAYDKVFGQVKELLAKADYSIVNLECPLVTDRNVRPAFKSGPNLKCETPFMVDASRWAGFNAVTLANNHFRDYGYEGVCTTLDTCKEHGLAVVGGGKNLEEASRDLYVTLKGEELAIINACEEEFSIATERFGGSNPLNPIRLFYDIREARQKADYCVVIVHGGVEMYQLPTPQMQQRYRFLVDAGANAVVNHHQHCFSGYERYNGSPIFYGLGNFCFDRPQSSSLWQHGYMVELELHPDGVEYKLHPYKQGTTNSEGVSLFQGVDATNFDEEISKQNKVIYDAKASNASYRSLIEDSRERRLWDFEPFYNRYLRYLQRHHLLPRLIRGLALTDYYDRMSCYAHRETLCDILKDEIYGKTK